MIGERELDGALQAYLRATPPYPEHLVAEAERHPRIGFIGSEPFDVVGGVAVSRLGHAVERTLDLVEADQKRTGQRRNSGHFKVLAFKRL